MFGKGIYIVSTGGRVDTATFGEGVCLGGEEHLVNVSSHVCVVLCVVVVLSRKESTSVYYYLLFAASRA